ncbi:MAG TPA: hypothetical protein VLN57_21135 [Xanthobacteraceae bacterium]|nr:hypothetical protein [Xanthobacteraceae bacterium]
MALTEDEKTLIREYLGWGARFGQTDNALERAMSALETSASELARTRVHLAELARIDAAITACEARFKADQVGTIKLSESELARLRSRGSERVGRLARQLTVETRGDPFRPGGSAWRGTFTGPIGGGNAQMQG